MRKLILIIAIVLIGVLLISYSVRISDYIYENFISDETAGTGSSSSTGNQSGGSSGDTSSDVLYTYYKISDTKFGKNYLVDLASVEHMGSYYYYAVTGTDYYVKYSEYKTSGTLCTDINDMAYLKGDVAILETKDTSGIINPYLIDPLNQLSCQYNVQYVTDIDEEKDLSEPFKYFDNCYFGDVLVYLGAYQFNNCFYVIKTSDYAVLQSESVTLFTNSPVFGYTLHPVLEDINALYSDILCNQN